MADYDMWGVGDQAGAIPFRKVALGKLIPSKGESGPEMLELIHGQHPHSRCDNNTYARTEDGAVYAFDGHDVLWALQIQEANYLKSSQISGYEVRKRCEGALFLNGFQVAELGGRTLEHCIRDAERLKAELPDKAGYYIDACLAKDPRALIGRRIYYRETPAHISSVIFRQACIVVRTSGPQVLFGPEPHELEDDDYEPDWDDDGRQSVKVSVLSPHIWWTRDRLAEGEEGYQP